MPNPQSRLLALAAEAKQQYLAECAAGGEPAYPAWIEDALAVCGGGQYGTLARTGNTARDQEMYDAGIEVGEANTKHNAAIRAGVPEGWKLVTKKTCYALMHDGAVIATLAGPESPANAAIIARMLAAPSCPTCNDQGAVGNILTAEPCHNCAAPGVSTVEDERQAFEAWAEDQGFVLDCDFFEVSGQYYDQDDTQLAYDIWRAARASVAAPAAGDALEVDPLQGAANWLVQAHSQPCPIVLSACLMIGYNRAQRLYDAAIAAQRKGGA